MSDLSKAFTGNRVDTMLCSGFDFGSKAELQGMKDLFFVLPPHPSSSAEVRMVLQKFFQSQPRQNSKEAIGILLIAVGEALANAIEHSASQGVIEVGAWMCESYGIVRVGDHGNGFIVEGIVFPPLESERGRGLPLMQSCTDILDISSRPGIGTIVTLVREL